MAVLPFLPSATSLVTKLLDDLITDSPESAFERATLPAGMEERIRTVDWNKRDVLIGLVTDSDHLQLFLKSKLYWTRRFDKVNLPIRYVKRYMKKAPVFGTTENSYLTVRENGHSCPEPANIVLRIIMCLKSYNGMNFRKSLPWKRADLIRLLIQTIFC
mgnify:CR=1 FL=1